MQPSTPAPRITKALVTRSPIENRASLSLETVRLRPVKENEVLVRVVATGICHSDVHYMTEPTAHGGIYPRVLGHEGAGYVVETGAAVTVVVPGDPVLMALPSCGTCQRCRNCHPCFCTTITNHHLKGEADVFRTMEESESEPGIYGQFHGQSSFAHYTIVKEGAVTNVKTLVETDEELMLFAPVVCGFQTGAGSLLSVAKATPMDSVAVIGLGGVGLGAVVAAKFRGCNPIIAIDLHQSRMDAAKKLGATHLLQSGSDFDFAKEIKDLTGGYGASIVLDTTGILKIIEAGVDAVEDGGRFVHVGIPSPITAELSISLIKFLGVPVPLSSRGMPADTQQRGISFMASKAGDIDPREFLPQMIKWYRDGVMAIDDLITFYPVDRYEEALQNMRSGRDIKSVLVW